MSTTDLSPARRRIIGAAVLLVAVVVVVSLGLLLQAYGPGNMGNGFLQGAGVATVAFAVALVRVRRAPGAGTTAERALTQHGDERDDAVLTRSLAFLGAVAIPLTGVAAVALALGAPVAMTAALLLYGQLAVGVIAFIVVNRRS